MKFEVAIDSLHTRFYETACIRQVPRIDPKGGFWFPQAASARLGSGMKEGLWFEGPPILVVAFGKLQDVGVDIGGPGLCWVGNYLNYWS